jgi:glutathione-specific gamma-glutamylcyclotransferase
MWIFGYGSLMFDRWEAACGCIDRKWADLPGYRRSFNKKSIESRGTREVPGLTLNLVRAAGHVCRGIAFAFEDNDRVPEILLDLQKREACKPRPLAVQLEDGRAVTAQCSTWWCCADRGARASRGRTVTSALYRRRGQAHGPQGATVP